MKRNLVIAVILIILVVGGLYFLFARESNDWKTYKGADFEFKYPKYITLSEKNNEVRLTHSIPFKHSNPCDFQGEGSSLKDLTDFNVALKIVDEGLKKTIIEEEGGYFSPNFTEGDKLKLEPGFIDEVIMGNKKGYRVTAGVEGCGRYNYYFPVNEKTLVVRRAFITEFSSSISNYQEYLNLPEIIAPEKEESIFNQIISSLRQIER